MSCPKRLYYNTNIRCVKSPRRGQISTLNLMLIEQITCYNLAVKVKLSRYKLGVAQRVGRGIALLFLDHDTRRG